jgi:hypothetical protein
MGPDDFKILVIALRELMGSLTVTLRKIIDQDDWIAAFFSVSAQPDSTAEPIATSGMVFARFDGKKMIKTCNCVDFINFFNHTPLTAKSERFDVR